ncbi:YggS family pyridoxal phosphate-dependent enzyme [Coralloluteibacterium thermophilus]|uniref:Pyridoxal phosphate homeostasis protein n=1 Tax=Coralloluteibacterium thermophilum TaxID=2707049 RepID=A0ABV9NIQ4_9GAMM
MPTPTAHDEVLQRIRAAAAGRPVELLAVSKTRSAEEVVALARRGQRRFGENYVQEAVAKRRAVAALAPDLDLEWHLIGRLQTNKARDAAGFDWVEAVDRPRLADALAAARPEGRPPLNVLIQVNPDGEPGKAGCAPDELDALAAHVAALPRLRLRGLMAIPAPAEDMRVRAASFRTLAGLFERLRGRHPDIDTLSMGMSDDFETAIAEGATRVRIGTALFGPRPPRPSPEDAHA